MFLLSVLHIHHFFFFLNNPPPPKFSPFPLHAPLPFLFPPPPPLEPLEPAGVVRRDRGERRRRDQTFVATCRAGQGVRAAAGNAPRGEALEPELVRDLSDIGDATDDTPARGARRGAVARPVVADQPDSLLTCELDVRLVRDACHRGALVDDHRQACAVALLAYLQ